MRFHPIMLTFRLGSVVRRDRQTVNTRSRVHAKIFGCLNIQHKHMQQTLTLLCCAYHFREPGTIARFALVCKTIFSEMAKTFHTP